MSRSRAHGGRPDGWQPMRRATVVPIPPEREATLLAAGADPALLDRSAIEMWQNNIYTVTVERFEDGNVQELSIRRNDRKAITDWRHKQRIKTEIAGPDVEAVEMYPAEDRLMDTANQAYLFCLLPGMRLPFGYDGPRNVRTTAEAEAIGAVQRELPEDWIRQESLR